MFDPKLTLETDRLLLKPPVAADFDAFCQMMADEESARFVGLFAGLFAHLCTAMPNFEPRPTAGYNAPP